MGWFFKRILSGFAIGTGFILSVLAFGYMYQKYIKIDSVSEANKFSLRKESGDSGIVTNKNVENASIIHSNADSFYYGHGDYQKAAELYLKAAELGYSDSQNMLGYMYRDGRGVEKNLEKSFYWFSEAAKQGSIDGYTNIGRAYIEGYYVEIDYKKAFENYKIAADGGDGYAMGQIGYMYEKGLYVERSHILSRDWYLKGKAAGDDWSTSKIRDGW